MPGGVLPRILDRDALRGELGAWPGREPSGAGLACRGAGPRRAHRSVFLPRGSGLQSVRAMASRMAGEQTTRCRCSWRRPSARPAGPTASSTGCRCPSAAPAGRRRVRRWRPGNSRRAGKQPRCPMVQRENFTFSELEQWLNTHRVTEIECLVPDLTGVARGKILPREKFTEDRGMRLPEAVVAMGVTGEFPEEGPYYDVISPTDQDMHLQADPTTVRIVPWATDPTAQVIHDCYDKRRQAGALRAALGAAPGLRPVRRRRLEAGGRARARVLPGRAQHRPRHAAEAADRPQRPRRDLAPGLFDRRGERVRPAVRGRLRLLREDGAERRHADPRGRRRADGDQLLPCRPAEPGRRGLPVQAHGARGGAAPRHVRHLHGQADRRRAGQRDARAPEPGQQGRPA